MERISSIKTREYTQRHLAILYVTYNKFQQFTVLYASLIGELSYLYWYYWWGEERIFFPVVPLNVNEDFVRGISNLLLKLEFSLEPYALHLKSPANVYVILNFFVRIFSLFCACLLVDSRDGSCTNKWECYQQISIFCTLYIGDDIHHVFIDWRTRKACRASSSWYICYIVERS